MDLYELYVPKILVIDDDQEMRRLLEDILTREGFHVTQAANGSEALRTIQEASYQVIILDKIMTDLSGIEILPEIKRLRPEAQVILITAFGDRETCVEAMGEGGDRLPCEAVRHVGPRSDGQKGSRAEDRRSVAIVQSEGIG
ncbi:MAG: response regulator [Candidatus Methylomirabilis sp.]|nr:response regulator [Candidatus Methylomirabilis sp.]